ncbi:MAG: histidine--tRNA ligase [Opitutales bacterium]|nr:histidine--tRNA ligase [Opitutales bacterium]
MLERLPGFRDFYPEDCARRDFIFRVWTEAARRHGFRRYDIPTLEPLELFTEKSGPEIVGQLFNFTDKGGREVALRPELTPSLARMVGARVATLKKPVKWFNIAENFRYEKPQEGRLRSHYQLNCDIFGEPGPAADAELMAVCLACLRGFGLGPEDFALRLSDRTLWSLLLEALGIAGDKAMEVLGIVDKFERTPREETLKRLEPHFGDAREDFLGQVETLMGLREIEEMGAFMRSLAPNAAIREKIEARLGMWRELLEALDAMDLTSFVRIDLGIVRGLAYYTGFVFEVFKLAPAGAGYVGRALAGGGRYDHLVGKLGFPATEAVGFGMGDVTMAQFLEEKKQLPPIIEAPDVYVVAAREGERRAALGLVSRLRAAGIRTEYALRAPGFGKQFRLAGQSGARLAVVVGTDELAAGNVRIKDLGSGGETLVPLAGAPGAARDALAGGIASA